MTPLYARTIEQGDVRVRSIEKFSSVWVVGVAPFRGLSRACQPVESREQIQRRVSATISRMSELWHESCHDKNEAETGRRNDDAIDQARPRTAAQRADGFDQDSGHDARCRAWS